MRSAATSPCPPTIWRSSESIASGGFIVVFLRQGFRCRVSGRAQQNALRGLKRGQWQSRGGWANAPGRGPGRSAGSHRGSEIQGCTELVVGKQCVEDKRVEWWVWWENRGGHTHRKRPPRRRPQRSARGMHHEGHGDLQRETARNDQRRTRTQHPTSLCRVERAKAGCCWRSPHGLCYHATQPHACCIRW